MSGKESPVSNGNYHENGSLNGYEDEEELDCDDDEESIHIDDEVNDTRDSHSRQSSPLSVNSSSTADKYVTNSTIRSALANGSVNGSAQLVANSPE